MKPHILEIREIALTVVVGMFLIAGLAAAFIAAERQIKDEALAMQEASVKW